MERQDGCGDQDGRTEYQADLSNLERSRFSYAFCRASGSRYAFVAFTTAPKMVVGFGLTLDKLVLSGHIDEVVDTIEASIRHMLPFSFSIATADTKSTSNSALHCEDRGFFLGENASAD
jgi:hypothetical protein